MAIPLTARTPVEFTPPSLPKRLQGTDPADPSKPRVRIIVRVPTMMERDTYSGALIRGGVISYTKSQIRDMALAGVQHLFPEETHEHKQELLREIWQVTDDEARYELDVAMAMRDEAEKAQAAHRDVDTKELEATIAEIPPAVQMDNARRIEAHSLNQEIMSRFDPLKQALASLTEQDAKRAWLNAEVYVQGWVGLPDQPDGNGRGGLTSPEVEYLRRQLGEKGFQELSDFITALQGLDEDEEKNLASLLATTSAQIGSTPSESKASSAVGNSTDEPSGSTPEPGSAKTTGSSSRSSASSATKTGRSRTGRTARQSSTSQ